MFPGRLFLVAARSRDLFDHAAVLPQAALPENPGLCCIVQHNFPPHLAHYLNDNRMRVNVPLDLAKTVQGRIKESPVPRKAPTSSGSPSSIYGAAAVQREACRAFYRQGADRLISDLAAYLRRADAQGTLSIRRPRQAADLFLSMFLGDGHIRGLMMLDMPDAREDKALLREAVRVFIAAYAKAP
jgi:hypothetical protein